MSNTVHLDIVAGGIYPSIKRDDLSVHQVSVKRRTIAAYFIRRDNPRYTVLISHGNAIDIGYMLPRLLQFSGGVNVNVFAYDYAGYGKSSEKPSIKRLYQDIEACIKYVTDKLGIAPSNIILYGQSLGTSPTVYQARARKDIAGVILHSPLLSGLRVMTPVQKTHWFDILNNVDIINEVTTPILIIHGTEDDAVPVHHGTELYEKSLKQYEPWYVEGAGHNDIETGDVALYFRKIDEFMTFLEKTRSQTTVLTSVWPSGPSSHLEEAPLDPTGS